jgi:hypothetical protein
LPECLRTESERALEGHRNAPVFVAGSRLEGQVEGKACEVGSGASELDHVSGSCSYLRRLICLDLINNRRIKNWRV